MWQVPLESFLYLEKCSCHGSERYDPFCDTCHTPRWHTYYAWSAKCLQPHFLYFGHSTNSFFSFKAPPLGLTFDFVEAKFADALYLALMQVSVGS